MKDVYTELRVRRVSARLDVPQYARRGACLPSARNSIGGCHCEDPESGNSPGAGVFLSAWRHQRGRSQQHGCWRVVRRAADADQPGLRVAHHRRRQSQCDGDGPLSQEGNADMVSRACRGCGLTASGCCATCASTSSAPTCSPAASSTSSPIPSTRSWRTSSIPMASPA